MLLRPPRFGRDEVESLPLAGRVGRTTAMRSIVRKWRPGWGLPRARLPLWLTPTRLAQIKNLGQPPSPQGGGIGPLRPLVFVCDLPTRREGTAIRSHQLTC